MLYGAVVDKCKSANETIKCVEIFPKVSGVCLKFVIMFAVIFFEKTRNIQDKPCLVMLKKK